MPIESRVGRFGMNAAGAIGRTRHIAAVLPALTTTALPEAAAMTPVAAPPEALMNPRPPDAKAAIPLSSAISMGAPGAAVRNSRADRG